MQYRVGGVWNRLLLSSLECELSLVLNKQPISGCDMKNAGILKFVKAIFFF
jgi:hypothetical protein